MGTLGGCAVLPQRYSEMKIFDHNTPFKCIPRSYFFADHGKQLFYCRWKHAWYCMLCAMIIPFTRKPNWGASNKSPIEALRLDRKGLSLKCSELWRPQILQAKLPQFLAIWRWQTLLWNRERRIELKTLVLEIHSKNFNHSWKQNIVIRNLFGSGWGTFVLILCI